jgi:type IV pilus assembly protein PilZ
MAENVRVINCAFTNEASLYMAYMTFLKDGGLFIRTNPTYSLGDEVELILRLMNEHEPYLIKGKVVWITPKGAQGNKPPGIGIEFTGENSRYVSNKIETYLAEMIKSTQITDTF